MRHDKSITYLFLFSPKHIFTQTRVPVGTHEDQTGIEIAGARRECFSDIEPAGGHGLDRDFHPMSIESFCAAPGNAPAAP